MHDDQSLYPTSAVETALLQALAPFRNRTVILGVSAGADSVAMFVAAMRARTQFRCGVRFIVGHFDHAWRETSAEDRRFVESIAAEENVACFTTRGSGRSARGSAEAHARDERMRWFQSIAAPSGAAAIFLAHHADDDREQTAIALLRKSGTRGLAGIRAERHLPLFGETPIIRPFMQIDRRTIHQYLRAHGRTWREDATNEDIHFLRNRLRHFVLDAAENEAPQFRDRLKDLQVRAVDLDRRMESIVDRFQASHVFTSADRSVRIDRAAWRALTVHLAYAVLRRAVEIVRERPLDLSPGAFAAIRASIERRAPTSRRFPLGHAVEMIEDDDGLIVRPTIARREPPAPIAIPIPGTVIFDHAIRFETTIGDSRHFVIASDHQPISRDHIRGVLHARRATVGEKFVPFGMSGRKLVSDLFQESGVPVEERARHPVIADDDGILWIPGVRAAERCRARREDDHLRMRYEVIVARDASAE